MHRVGVIALGMVMVGMLGSRAGGAVIASYTFENFEPSVVHDAVTATAVTQTGTLTEFVLDDLGYDSKPVLKVRPGAPQNLIADSFDAGDYFELTITPDAGETLSFTAATFRAAKGGSQGIRRVGVRTSLTGDGVIWETEVASEREFFGDAHSIDLGSIDALQDVTGPVTFQFAVATGNTGRSIEFDDLTFEATVLPEPASAALVLAGLLLAASRGRRRA